MSTSAAKVQVLNARQMRQTRNDLPLDVRRNVIEIMNGILAETIDLGLAARQAHWNLRGRNFSSLHALFDKIHDELSAHADTLAERIAALGGLARGTAQSVAAETALDPYPALAVSEEEHLDALSMRLGQLASAVHHAIGESMVLEDPVSGHYLTEAAAAIEKLLWLTESHMHATL
jgi:starvation-inducible DNA-binding protein